ncbi:hypothetical protein BGX34_003953 [Mortierella sp. NVP85]|nr:hypothetical protein BGX34_003953 [Mortierella sp. NVP85]
MPTLQSKYGTPGRELGAGTQAQVMLLRVKSSKHLRGTQRKDANKYWQNLQQSSKDELALGDYSHSDDLLSPHSRSGNFKTTTEDEVTPSQREAYRKRLLHRTSTGGISTTGNGGLIYAIKKFRPPKETETHRQYLKKVCAEFCISTSMDHENIIRTIDLVRDHPGQDPVENEDAEEDSHKDDHRDCNCSKEHHHRISASMGTEAQRHRSILRKSVVFRPQQNQSVDTLSSSSKRTLGEHGHPYNPSPSGQICQHGRQMEHPRYQDHVDRVVSVGLSQSTATAKKKKQQAEQELRQKEVQRLKQQRQREKQQAEQWRLDQFPEYCMVMEFAAGGDLFNLLTSSHPISLHEKHCLWRQLVNGVQYMHSIGVAHRDLKPENILLDGTGRILKITDFGIANVFKSVGDPIPLPCHGIIGSEPYIAPEEFYQDEYDPRAVDVWACGIIFYVMYYSAMPWARADRKKDARFARFINDIMVHRQVEPQRRQRYERRKLQHGRSSNSFPAPIGLNGVGPNQHTEYVCDNRHQLHNNTQSSGSPTRQEGSAVYNTYAYNNHIGGHGFIDRIESPGCRRVLYGILEPDARKRLTIDQVVNDEWVARIRYCTDCVTKQEQQVMMFGEKSVLAPHNYLQLPSGQLHHQHTIPKKNN